jgi:hypothetical protein
MASYRAMQCHLSNDQDSLTTEKYTSIGENLAKTLIFSGTELVHGYINFTQLVGYWYSQHIFYNVADNTCTIPCNQFLQVFCLLSSMRDDDCIMYSRHRWYGLALLL